MANVTLKDVAKLAGVSFKTVSRVVNQEKSVKEETKKKVLEAIKATGYKTNLMAKSLRKSKTNIIIVFVEEKGIGNWSIWRTNIIQMLLKEVKAQGYKMVFSSSNADSVDEKAQSDGFELLKSGLADGAIIFDSEHNDDRINYLRNAKIPFITIGRDINYTDTNYIDLNNYDAGVIGARHLLEKGYRKICVMLGKKTQTVSEDRLEGIFAESKKYPDSKITPIYNIKSNEKSYEKADELIKQGEIDSFFIIKSM